METGSGESRRLWSACKSKSSQLDDAMSREYVLGSGRIAQDLEESHGSMVVGGAELSQGESFVVFAVIFRAD